MTFDRESGSTDALLTDLYLDALLAGAVLDAAGWAEGPGAHLDSAARRAADRLRSDLVRVHPSFRFEERLATRLAEAAAAMGVQIAAGGDGGHVLAFRPGPPDGSDRGHLIPAKATTTTVTNPTDVGRPGPLVASAVDADPGRTAGSDGLIRRTPAHPYLLSGALTSAAISIAGAAFVAWRFGRPGRASTPMARAARAVRSGVPGGRPAQGPRRGFSSPSTRGFD
ncbi:MAG: hypothetical protein ABIZ72_01315 [Candidatus Limnocylindrales bacterium]